MAYAASPVDATIKAPTCLYKRIEWAGKMVKWRRVAASYVPDASNYLMCARLVLSIVFNLPHIFFTSTPVSQIAHCPSQKEVGAILKSRPRNLFYALTCVVVLLVPGIFGVIYAARLEVDRAKELARDGVCLELSNGITQQLHSIFLGVKSMVSHVRQNPNCRRVYAVCGLSRGGNRGTDQSHCMAQSPRRVTLDDVWLPVWA